jgi:hypothetical protein
VSLTEDHHVIQTFTSNGADHPLRECILPWTPGRADDLLHAQGLESVGLRTPFIHDMVFVMLRLPEPVRIRPIPIPGFYPQSAFAELEPYRWANHFLQCSRPEPFCTVLLAQMSESIGVSKG